MQNISDALEDLTLEKETEFTFLINKTNFSHEAKQVINFLHNRIIDLERKEKKNTFLETQKHNALAKSFFTPNYAEINNNYMRHTTAKQHKNDEKVGKKFITGMSLAEQKAQEFNRKAL